MSGATTKIMKQTQIPKAKTEVVDYSKPIRCQNCQRLLIVASTVIGKLRCVRCKHVNDLHIVSQRDILVLAGIVPATQA